MFGQLQGTGFHIFGDHNVGIFGDPMSFRSLVGLPCAPILVTRCASRVRVLISASLCGPQNWTNAQYYKNAISSHALSGGRADSAMHGHVAASYVQAFSLV